MKVFDIQKRYGISDRKLLEEAKVSHRQREHVGGRNKLAKLLGVTGPYLGRVLSGEKPMTEELLRPLPARSAL